MVKSIIYTVVAIILCIALFVSVQIYIGTKFEEFNSALQTLYAKVENHTATREDGNAVKSMWNDKKSKLHIFLPHNDISYIDYWLSEACTLIYCENYDLALGKIAVLIDITDHMPDGYSLKLENVF